MDYIRKADIRDASRLAEILIFTKRMNYREIFQNDKISFGEMQVYPLAQDYITNREKLEHIWVYDDEFVKGMIHIEGRELIELYVDVFFQNMGIGARLMEFAIHTFHVQKLFVLEKNNGAIRFYQRHGFLLTQERQFEKRNDRIYCKNGAAATRYIGAYRGSCRNRKIRILGGKKGWKLENTSHPIVKNWQSCFIIPFTQST